MSSHYLKGETINFDQFFAWLRKHRDSDGYLRVEIKDCTITDIPPDETIFQSIKYTITYKNWLGQDRTVEAEGRLICGFPAQDSLITGCRFIGGKMDLDPKDLINLNHPNL